MNTGKAKCERLKQIRKDLAEQLNIDLQQKECTFKGNCKGTCPKCKQEEQILNNELLKRVVVLGVGALATLSLAGCTPNDKVSNEISGNMTYEEVEDTDKELEQIDEGMSEYLKNNLEHELTMGVIEPDL